MRILIVWLMLLSLAPVYASDKLKVNYALGDYYYPYVGQHHKSKGCLTEFVTKVFTSQGVSLGETRWLPWSVAMKSLNYAGAPMVSFPWGYTKERAKHYLYSEAIYTEPTYIWVLTINKGKYSGFKELEGVEVCIPQGYGAFGEMQAMLNQKKVTRITALTMQDCFNQLKNNRVMAVYASEDATDNIAHITGGQKLFTRAFIADMLTYYLIAGKNQPYSGQLIKSFNKGLKQFKFNPANDC